MYCLGRVVLPYQISVTLEVSILTKKMYVGKVQTLLWKLHDFAPLSNFLFSLTLLYMELHTHFQRVYDAAGDYQYTTARICL